MLLFCLQFSDFDTSGDGSIAASELAVLMKSMEIETTLDEVHLSLKSIVLPMRACL